MDLSRVIATEGLVGEVGGEEDGGYRAEGDVLANAVSCLNGSLDSRNEVCYDAEHGE